jgi:hypothetical protein
MRHNISFRFGDTGGILCCSSMRIDLRKKTNFLFLADVLHNLSNVQGNGSAWTGRRGSCLYRRGFEPTLRRERWRPFLTKTPGEVSEESPVTVHINESKSLFVCWDVLSLTVTQRFCYITHRSFDCILPNIYRPISYLLDTDRK